MKLYELLCDVEYVLLYGDLDVVIDDISYDSRDETARTVYVSISDNENYIDEAIKKGAVAVVIWWNISFYIENVTYIKVDNPRKALFSLSNTYFNYPASDMYLIGITGTKGKTTTAYMIHSILTHAGIKCGLIGTIEVLYDGKSFSENNTTPESYVLLKHLKNMKETGTYTVVMEVSSQGLKHDRVAGLEFNIGIFTNISNDHISEREHRDFDEYLHYKSKLFRKCKVGIINLDDAYAHYIIDNSTCDIKTFALKTDATLRGMRVKDDGLDGVSFLAYGTEISLKLPGVFNVYNCLAAILGTYDLLSDMANVSKALSNISIKGRFEILKTGMPFDIIIDYAHNDSSLRCLLETLRSYDPGRIICCFGCGGNRDKGRRRKMGHVSALLSDITIVTSDNPRYEEPESIMDDIIAGIKEKYGIYIPIVSRREAVHYALKIAREGDIVVFAGKGHEEYEEIRGEKHPFCEREIIINTLKELY